MMSRKPLILLMVAGAAALAAGCQSTLRDEALPAGDDSVVFFGSGRERLDFKAFPAIRFEAASWEVVASERDRLREALAGLVGGRRLLVVGVGDDDVPAEHGRQQAMARALNVRRALISLGEDASLVVVTGLSAGEAAGVMGRDVSGPRAECAVIR